MFITTVTRSYKRSINLKSYGSNAESWVTCEATYTAQCETPDDPIAVSKMLAEQAQKDVADQISDIIQKVKAANPNTVPANIPPAQPAVATQPVAPAAPRPLA